MFDAIKDVLNKYENIMQKELTEEDVNFVENIELYLSIAIRNEMPQIAYSLGKILTDMGELSK